LTDATVSQCERLHVKCSFNNGWDIFDSDLPGDIESTKCATLDEISRVVGFSRIDRKDLVLSHIHVGTEKIEEHVPSPDESCLVNAAKEASQVLIDENEVSINRSNFQDGKESVNIS